MNKYDISRGLRQVKAREGWTMLQLGEALGVCKNHAFALCGGNKMLTVAAITRHADKLGVTVVDLIGFEPEPEKKPPRPDKGVIRGPRKGFHCVREKPECGEAWVRLMLTGAERDAVTGKLGEPGELGDYLSGDGDSVFRYRRQYSAGELAFQGSGRQITAKHSGG